MATNKSSLQTIYSWSLNLNNMISLSLVKDTEAEYNNKRFFIFLNAVPAGEKNDGTRTYEFKNGINYKLQPIKLYEISTTISAYIRGQSKMIGNYGIINDTSKSSYGNGQSDMKSLYFNYVPADEEKNKGIPGIGIVAKHGNQSVKTYLPAPTALAFAEMCKKFFDEAIRQDMGAFTFGSSNYQKRGDDFGGSETKKSNSSNQISGSENYPSFTSEEPF